MSSTVHPKKLFEILWRSVWPTHIELNLAWLQRNALACSPVRMRRKSCPPEHGAELAHHIPPDLMYTKHDQFIQLSRQFYMNQVARKRQLFEQGKEAAGRTVLCSPRVVPAAARVNFNQGKADPANSCPRFIFSFYIDARDFDAKIMCPLKFES
jgi:hypothetical protein